MESTAFMTSKKALSLSQINMNPNDIKFLSINTTLNPILNYKQIYS